MTIKQKRRGRPPKGPDKIKGIRLDMRIEAVEKEGFRRAAELAGLDLSGWIRERLRLAAREELEKAGLAVPLKRQLVQDNRSILVPLSTFAPEPYTLTREIQVLILPDNDSFVASLVDANINASGETVPKAVANLKDMMIRLFERLSREPKENLGKWPARQLSVLKELMRRKAKHAARQ